MTRPLRFGTFLGTLLALSLASSLVHAAEEGPASPAPPPAPTPKSLFVGLGGGQSMGQAMGESTTGGSVQGWVGVARPLTGTIDLRLGAIGMHDWSKTELKTGVWRTRAGGRLGFMIGGKLEIGTTVHAALIEIEHRKHDGSLLSPGLGAAAFAMIRPYQPSKSIPFSPFLMATATGDAFFRNGNSPDRLYDVTAMISFGMEFGHR